MSDTICAALTSYQIESWKSLLQIAEQAKPPSVMPVDSAGWCGDVEFIAEKGWRVVIFYDCGEIDYIAHFVTPSGELVDFWHWPESHPWKGNLMAWRDVGDLDRLSRLDS